jgi:Tfp pilus assembly protein PilF
MPSDRQDKTRLTTWKEVAAFFGKTERTVMRWEAERGLPVRRLPGEARSGIYADVSDLEAWLRGAGAVIGAPADPLPAAAPVAPPPPPARFGVATTWQRPERWIAGVVATALGGGLLLGLARYQPPEPAAPPEAARAEYIAGLQDWAQRTPATLLRAVDEFTAAIRIDPDYAESYAGLANCYNLLRQYSSMPDGQAFMLAKRAAARALELNPDSASAHAAYGFAVFWGDWRFAEGLAEFDQALRLEPDNPSFHHWKATALLSIGQGTQALAEIDRALELEPDAPAVRANRGQVLRMLGRNTEARAVLEDVIARAPDLVSAHAYLGALALETGDDATYLRETELQAQLRHDTTGEAIARAAREAYASGGHQAMLRALLHARLAAFEAGTGTATEVAIAYSKLGNAPQTIAYLSRAIDRHDEGAFAVTTGLRTFLGDAAIMPLLRQLGLPDPPRGAM